MNFSSPFWSQEEADAAQSTYTQPPLRRSSLVGASSTVNSAYVRLILWGARDKGVDINRVLRRSGIALEDLQSSQNRIPVDRYARFLTHLARATGDELWLLGDRPVRPGTLSMLCRMLIGCTSLHEALGLAGRFYRSVSDDFVVRTVENDPLVRVVIHCRVEGTRGRMLIGAVLLFAYGLICWLVGRKIPLAAVHYKHDRTPFSVELERIYGCPISFNQETTELCFHRRLLSSPVSPDSEHLKGLLAAIPERLIGRYDAAKSVSLRVRGLLKRSLRDPPSLKEVATAVYLTPETVRRRLRAEEGCGFQELKDRVRSEVARQMLSTSTFPLGEISAALGFAEPSTFHRAFKRWTGETPGDFRARTSG